MIAASGPIVRTPTLEQLREYAARLEQERQIPEGLYSTLVQAESSWNPQAVSPTGARGLAQIIPSTGRQPGFGVQPVKNIDDPFENLRFGSDYLGAMLKRYNGDKEAALLAYNQGPGYADKWIRAQRNFAALPEKVRAEGQPYVQKILRGIADAVIPAAYAADEPDAGFAQLESELDAVAAPDLDSGLEADLDAFAELDAQAPQEDMRSAAAQQAPASQVEYVSRAIAEPSLGAAQLVSRPIAWGAQFLPEGEFRTTLENLPQSVDAATKSNSETLNANDPEGFPYARMAGNVVGSIPQAVGAAAAVPAAIATRVGAMAPVARRAIQGAAVGAAGGAATPVADTEDGFARQKALQTAGGAVVGGALGPAAGKLGEWVSGLAGVVVNTARRVFGGNVNPQQAEAVLEATLKAQGIDPSQLNRAMKDQLKVEVQKALNAGGGINEEALANKTVFNALGIRPTKGQITRDPKQWQDEFNLRQLTGGEALMDQYRNATVGLSRNLNEVRAGTGGADVTPYAAGEKAIETLARADKRIKGGVDAAYDAARAEVGIHTPLNSRSFADRVIQQLDDQQVGDKLPAAFRTTLNQISAGEFPFTIQKAEQVLRAANQRAANTQDKVERFALGIFQKELRDAIDKAGSAEGQAAAAAFQNARKLASGRFKLHEVTPALKAVADGDITADDFLKKFVVGAKVEELAQLKRFLTTPTTSTERALVPYEGATGEMQYAGVQAWNNIRAQLIDKLKAASIQGEGNDIRFLQASYNKALNSLPEEKLRILFSPSEIQKLRFIGKAGRAIQQEPAGAVPNRSGTAAAMLNRIGAVLETIPGLGPFGGVIVRGTLKAGQGGVNAAKAARAQGSAPISTPRNALIPPEYLDILSLGGGLAGGAAINPLSQ